MKRVAARALVANEASTAGGRATNNNNNNDRSKKDENVEATLPRFRPPPAFALERALNLSFSLSLSRAQARTLPQVTFVAGSGSATCFGAQESALPITDARGWRAELMKGAAALVGVREKRAL